jgi:hypothetical protein
MYEIQSGRDKLEELNVLQEVQLLSRPDRCGSAQVFDLLGGDINGGEGVETCFSNAKNLEHSGCEALSESVAARGSLQPLPSGFILQDLEETDIANFDLLDVDDCAWAEAGGDQVTVLLRHHSRNIGQFVFAWLYLSCMELVSF